MPLDALRLGAPHARILARTSAWQLMTRELDGGAGAVGPVRSVHAAIPQSPASSTIWRRITMRIPLASQVPRSLAFIGGFWPAYG